MRRRFIVLATLVLSLTATQGIVDAQNPPGQAATPPAAPQRARPLPSIAERTDGYRKLDGFYPLYWDEATGTLYLEIPGLDRDVLYVNGLSAGLGMYLLAVHQGYSNALPLALVVLGAMASSCALSGLSGALVPLSLRRFGADPALASSILLTTATVVVSIGLLLGLATWLVL